MQDVFQRHVVIDQHLGEVGQPLNLFGGVVTTSRDESLHLADRCRQICQRRVQIGPAVVEQAGQRGEPVVELHDLLVAVAQRGDDGLQVLDDVDDVAAATGQDPPYSGQLSQRLPKLVAVTAQRVGGAVDEPCYRGCRHLAARSQIRCQPS